MKTTICVTIGLALLVLAAAPPAAAEEKKDTPDAKKAPPDPLGPNGEFPDVFTECSPTPKQQADFKARIKARDDALAAWDARNGDRRAALAAQERTASAAHDYATFGRVSKERMDLVRERDKIWADATSAILAVLTLPQRATLEGRILLNSMKIRYARANLTAEQQAKIRKPCNEYGKDIAVPWDEKARFKARHEAIDKLVPFIESLLTPAQRTAMSKPAPENG
jgi:hypothetical protein